MEGCAQRKTLSHSFEAINSLKSCQKRGFAGARHWHEALRGRPEPERGGWFPVGELALQPLRIPFRELRRGARYVCPVCGILKETCAAGKLRRCRLQVIFCIPDFLRPHAGRRRQIGKRLFIWQPGSPRCRHGDTSKMERNSPVPAFCYSGVRLCGRDYLFENKCH